MAAVVRALDPRPTPSWPRPTLEMNTPGSWTPKGWLEWSEPPTMLSPSGPPDLGRQISWECRAGPRKASSGQVALAWQPPWAGLMGGWAEELRGTHLHRVWALQGGS